MYKFMSQHKVDIMKKSLKHYIINLKELKVTDESSEYYIPNINLHLITNYLEKTCF